MLKTFFVEEKQLYYLTHCRKDKAFCTFPKGIGPNMNEIP